MLHRLLLFADDAKPAEAPDFFSAFFQSPLFPLFAIFFVFFFLFILPAKRRERQQRQQLFSKLKKNDEVVTSAGIIGIVANIKETGDEVTLKVDESSNVRLRVLKSSIVRILNVEKSGKESSNKSDTSEAITK